MKVSVIIPFYSNISWLEEAVNSVLEQTFKDFEIIVVNDGSPEDDRLFLEKYSNHLRYFKIENGGPARARNYGIKEAKGDYVAFLDSDDLWTPNKLETQLSEMIKNNVVWSHTNYSTFNEKGDVKEIDLNYYDGNMFPMSLYSMHVATPSVILKRIVFDNDNYCFQEKMRFGQDYFLWLMLSKKYPILLIKESLCKVRLRGSNAALRARAHIQVRGQVWKILRGTEYFQLKQSSVLTKFAYSWSSRGLKCVIFFEKLGFGKRFIELISRLFYMPSFIIFKMLFNKYRR